jgi:hypothetical protein
MVSKHCNACGADAHPKLRHPSSLKLESSLWAVAIVVGLFAGTFSAAKRDSGPTLSHVLQSVSLSIAQPSEQPSEVLTTDTRGSQSTGVLFLTWFTTTLVDFLKTAWWVLPIPVLFSLWRQFKPYEVCGHCGARDLVPVVVPHGDEPPFF